jgi:hypothetical protein
MQIERDFDLNRKPFDESQHQIVIRDAANRKDSLEEQVI